MEILDKRQCISEDQLCYDAVMNQMQNLKSLI